MLRNLQYGSVELVVGDIVDQQVDAVVNAANTSLLGGGGVDGAIHRAAGPQLLESCRRLPEDERGCRCPTGEVRTTAAGNLAAKYVIHAVGPVYEDRHRTESEEKLRQVHRAALNDAVERDCRSIAFPAISTGAFLFPVDQAARIAIDVACTHAEQRPAPSLIRFVLRSAAAEAFRTALQRWSDG